MCQWKMLRLEIEREAVRQYPVHRFGNLAHGLVGQVGRRIERVGAAFAAGIEGSDFAHGITFDGLLTVA